MGCLYKPLKALFPSDNTEAHKMIKSLPILHHGMYLWKAQMEGQCLTMFQLGDCEGA